MSSSARSPPQRCSVFVSVLLCAGSFYPGPCCSHGMPLGTPPRTLLPRRTEVNPLYQVLKVQLMVKHFSYGGSPTHTHPSTRILGVLLQTDALEGTERLQVRTRLSAGGEPHNRRNRTGVCSVVWWCFGGKRIRGEAGIHTTRLTHTPPLERPSGPRPRQQTLTLLTVGALVHATLQVLPHARPNPHPEQAWHR